VQVRLETALTSEEYISQRAWETAKLEACPAHPGGARCGFAGHGTYERVEPAGAKVARYYCPRSHTTFSLLPDCLASRLSSTLKEVEDVVAAAEASPSQEQAAAKLRPDIVLPSAVRWLRRRLVPMRVALVALITWHGLEVAPRVAEVRASVATRGLGGLRDLGGAQLHALPPPLGLGPRQRPRSVRRKRTQQGTGTDPPAQSR